MPDSVWNIGTTNNIVEEPVIETPVVEPVVYESEGKGFRKEKNLPEYVYDPSIVIFERLFTIRLPNVYAIEKSAGYMTMVGDESVDKQHMLKHVTVMWNIAKICDHHAEGKPYSFIKREVVQQVYRNIRDYLEAWTIEIDRQGLFVSRGPYQDLLKLDSMAKDIWDKYKLYLDEKYRSYADDKQETVHDVLDAIYHRKHIAKRSEEDYDDSYTKIFTKLMFAESIQNKGDKNELRRKSFKK